MHPPGERPRPEDPRDEPGVGGDDEARRVRQRRECVLHQGGYVGLQACYRVWAYGPWGRAGIMARRLLFACRAVVLQHRAMKRFKLSGGVVRPVGLLLMQSVCFRHDGLSAYITGEFSKC